MLSIRHLRAILVVRIISSQALGQHLVMRMLSSLAGTWAILVVRMLSSQGYIVNPPMLFLWLRVRMRFLSSHAGHVINVLTALAQHLLLRYVGYVESPD